MNTVYIDKNTGLVCVANTVITFNDDTVFMYTEETIDPNLVYVDSGKICVAEKPPNIGKYVFNTSTKTWDKDLNAQWRVVRSKRAYLLSHTDWTQLPDVPLDTKERWKVYRQALRDITLQADPFNIIWPIAPEG